MERFDIGYLNHWLDKPNRKPLIIRGARQVGKSTLVRLFAEQAGLSLVELNLEDQPALADLLLNYSPMDALTLLETQLDQRIELGKVVLFIDEIQAVPEVLAKLRYFYEKLPQLPVIAAGSLLEFALEDFQHAMPVGRIEYMYMGPMQFEEYLLAVGKEKLQQYLQNFQYDQSIPEAIHLQLTAQLKQYMLLGGMPEVISMFVQTQSLIAAESIKHQLVGTYQDDFAKYGAKINLDTLRLCFKRIPFLVGKKLKYVAIDKEVRAETLLKSLRQLEMAHIIYLVHDSHANGAPLQAEVVKNRMKPLYLDVGLMNTASGLSAADVSSIIDKDILRNNRGALAEQFVGQHLLYAHESFEKPSIYYWSREEPQRNAEVDYLMTIRGEIIPIEVKAGTGGTLRSMHQFLLRKKCQYALRFNMDAPSLLKNTQVNVMGEHLDFNLLSIPLYLVGQTHRLLSDWLG